MTSSALPLLALTLSAVLGLWLLERVIQRTDVGLAVALGAHILTTTLSTTATVVLGIGVGLNDLAYVLLLVAAVARLLRSERWSPPQLLLAGILVLIAVSVARGWGEFGYQTVLNMAREPIRLFGGALYFSTMEPRRDLFDRLAAIWLMACGVLGALAVLRWGADAVGLTGGVLGSGGDLRVLPSSGALVLTIGFIITLVAQRRPGHPWWMRPASGGLLLLVVLLQHRTTWVVLLMTLVVMAVRDRDLAPRLVAAVAVGTLAGAVLIMTVLGGDQPIQGELASSARDADTFEWRVAGWAAILEQTGPETPLEVAFGQPYGTPWDRRIDGRVTSVSPHSFYIEMGLRTGVVGLASILLLHAVPLVRLLRLPRHRRDVAGEALFVIGCGLLVYYITYAAPLFVSVLIGAMASWTWSGHRVIAPDTRLGSGPGPAPRRVGVGAAR